MTRKVSAKEVSELRARTGVGLMECKKALQETAGDMEKAVDLLRQKGFAKAAQRAGRTASEGHIGSYVHFNGRVGVLVEVNCETDFVARTEDFQGLTKNLALHIASANPIGVSQEDVPQDLVERERAIIAAQVAESGKPDAVRGKIIDGKLKKFFQERVLLEQTFVKDNKKTVGDLVKEVATKVGENVVVRRFVRFELGAG